jgi:hypothetical protein
LAACQFTSSHLRSSSSSKFQESNTCYQLRYADGVLFPHRIPRLPDSRNGWHARRRSVHSEEACIWNDPLGCIRCIQAKFRSTPRKFLSAFRGLVLDNLGAYVTLFCSSRLILLLLPRDFHVQHPLPARPPSPQGYRKPFNYVRFRDRFNDNDSW